MNVYLEDQHLLNIWIVYHHLIEVLMVHCECQLSKDTKFVNILSYKYNEY